MADSEPLRITEIGPSAYPVANILRTDLVPNNAKLAFVEPSKTNLSQLTEKLDIDDIKSLVVQAELPNLPYADNSQDTIVIANVFGTPNAIRDFVTNRSDQMGYTSELYNTHKWMTEIKRVTKPGGKIVIIETSTPLPIDTMKSLCESLDLPIIEEYRKNEISKVFDPNNKVGYKMGTSFEKTSDKDSYVFVLQK